MADGLIQRPTGGASDWPSGIERVGADGVQELLAKVPEALFVAQMRIPESNSLNPFRHSLYSGVVGRRD
ncbi:MAG: hypothetical protein Q9169_000780 [Polycauliona sp. 2 TL-2023]